MIVRSNIDFYLRGCCRALPELFSCMISVFSGGGGFEEAEI